MDKFYFASSDGSVRDAEGELYHWGWKKKDAKYIKRERKNGKWVYTYPEDKKSANRKTSKEYEAEVAYNSQKNVYPGQSTTSKNNTNRTTSSSTNSTNKKGSSEYEAEVAYNSQKNVYPGQYASTKVNTGRSVLGVANSGAADASVRKQAEVNRFVASVRENARKAAENKKALEGRANSGSKTVEKADPKQVERAKNVADFWKAFNKSKTFYSRGNDAAPDVETKTKIAEQSSNKKANADDYEKYLQYRKNGAESARNYDKWKNDPKNGYWQEIEQKYQKESAEKEERGLVRTLVDAAKDWWGDDEREYYERLKSEKYTNDRQYYEAGDRAWDTLDALGELEEAAKTGTKRVTQNELETAYTKFWNAANYLDYTQDHKDACDKAFDAAEEAYRKTKAFKHDQRVQSVEDFIEDVGDGIEEGREWMEDRLDDLEDLLRKRR